MSLTNKMDVIGRGDAASVASASPAVSESLQPSFLKTLLLCFLAILLDGLDTGSIGVAGPAIAAHFGVSTASLTLPFIMTSIGAVLGYLASGYLVARWRARRVLIFSVIGFGVLTLATPFASSIIVLSILRLVTAIGLGAALPSAVAIAVLQAPVTLRAAATIVVGTGLAAGGALGGALGGLLTRKYGWESLFYFGGALPLLLSLVLLRWLPASDEADAAATAAGDKRMAGNLKLISSIFAGSLGGRTAGLWVFSFLIFADAYALIFWLPPLLIGFGFPAADGQFAVGFFSAGGLIANLIVVPLVGRFAVTSVMRIAASTAGLCVTGIALWATTSWVWALILGAGAGLIACSVGQSALAVSIYPAPLRTNGVGFSAAAGRIGSIVGPAFVGLLFSLGWSPKSIVLAAAVPILAAILVLLLLPRSVQGSELWDVSAGKRGT
ncbi:arabinose efflux permease family protein [Bradyrhizobium sp. WSM1253]|nr:arabinose efflux permease family protein [Bradyrhizobium sp. WSM1253]